MVLFDALVGLDSLVHANLLVGVERLGDFGGLVHVRLQVGRLGQFENVRVKGRHFRSDIVKEISLLHVAAINPHRYLLVKLLDCETHFNELFLSDDHLYITVVGRKSIKCLQRESVRSEWVQAKVCLRRIIDQKDGIFELAL